MTAPWIEHVFTVLSRWEALGVQAFPDGTRRIGHVPHVAPEAYLHSIPAGLTSSEIDQLENLIRRTFPFQVREFFLSANGLKAFSNSLGLFGYRQHYRRGDWSEAAAQPFHIDVPNIKAPPKGLDGSSVVVGYYDFDGSIVIVEADGTVLRCDSDDARQVLTKWTSFQEWLTSEIDRISLLFDPHGRCLDKGLTLPIAQI
jgi:hypothetical protein